MKIVTRISPSTITNQPVVVDRQPVREQRRVTLKSISAKPIATGTRR